jgi:carbonic anhydrase/acetyltransferase-like protein (isoleucine patch superfamily)
MLVAVCIVGHGAAILAGMDVETGLFIGSMVALFDSGSVGLVQFGQGAITPNGGDVVAAYVFWRLRPVSNKSTARERMNFFTLYNSECICLNCQ